MNTTKIYQDGDDLLLETNKGNFIISDNGVKQTTRTGNDLSETSFDFIAQTKIENAITAMSQFVSVDLAKGLAILIDEKVEDLD